MSFHHSPKIVTNGLVLCLDAGNRKSYPGSGTVWTDLSNSGNNGTLVNDGPNNFTFNPANRGSIGFDGYRNYVNCRQGNAASSWTLNSFLNPKSSSKNSQILGRTGGSDTSYIQNYGIFQISTNRFVCQTSADSYKRATSTTSIVINTWYFVTGTYNSTSKILSIYINGLFENSSSALIQNPPTGGNQYLTVGAGDGLMVNNPFFGNIAFASIYNRALSDAEILQNYNALKGRFGL